MNTMATALKEAHLAIPLNRRVWNFCKDNPNKTVNEVAAALNETRGNVSSHMSDMAMRGMLIRAQDLSTKRPGRGGMALYRYQVPQRMKEFEMLHRPADTITRRHPPDPIRIADIPPIGLPAPVAVAPKPWSEVLTLAQAYKVYLELREMFGFTRSAA